MRTPISLAVAGALAVSSLSLFSGVAPASAAPAETAYALGGSGTTLVSFPVSNPGYVASTSITGVTAGETLVGLDVRPQNGGLYAFGVNATANTGTLYFVAEETSKATSVGTAGGVAFTTDGSTPVDLPDPATVGWDMDFSTTADLVRVVAGGLNFRVNANFGTPVDGNNGGGVTAGTNPDGATNAGTTSVEGVAYTNAANSFATTLYTLDSTTNHIFIQNAPNSGTQTLGSTLTLGGNTLDFTASGGFDIDQAVSAPATNAAVVSGSAYAVLQVAGKSGLYRIDLTNGVTTALGLVGAGTPVRGLALQRDLDDGRPVVSLTTSGTLMRFNTKTPGTTTSVALSGITAGETLVAICWRPATGQLLGFGVNAVAETGTLYIIDPQTAVSTAVGTSSQVSWGTNLADPTAAGYGMDVSPNADRVRIVAADGLNARINPNTGAPVDGDPGTGGTQPDATTSAAGVVSVAYANSYAGATATTLFDLDAATDQLLVQEPPNNGVLGQAKAITADGAPLDFTAMSAFDLPADVRVASSGAGSTGTALAVLMVDGTSRLYDIGLATGVATLRGTMGALIRSIAVGEAERDRAKVPATLATVAKPKQVKAKVNTGRVLTCPAGFATSQCAATVKVKAGTKLLAKKVLTVSRGAKKRLVVPLSAKGKAFVVRKGTVKSVVTITCPCGPGATSKTYRLRLTLSAAKF